MADLEARVSSYRFLCCLQIGGAGPTSGLNQLGQCSQSSCMVINILKVSADLLPISAKLTKQYDLLMMNHRSSCPSNRSLGSCKSEDSSISSSWTNSDSSLPYLEADNLGGTPLSLLKSWTQFLEEWSKTEQLWSKLPRLFEQSSDSDLHSTQSPSMPFLYQISLPEWRQKTRNAGLWGTMSFLCTTLQLVGICLFTYLAQFSFPTLGCPIVYSFTLAAGNLSLKLAAAKLATAPPRLWPVKMTSKVGKAAVSSSMAVARPSLASLLQELKKPECTSQPLQPRVSSLQEVLMMLASVIQFKKLAEPRKTTMTALSSGSTPTSAKILLPRTCFRLVNSGQQLLHLLAWQSALLISQMAVES